MNKEKTHKIISVQSEQEAEKNIYTQLQQGLSYRQITQTKFQINDRIKGYNISQISQIKKRFESNTISEKNNVTSDQKTELINIFKLIKKGIPLDEILIKIGDPKLVNSAINEYKKIVGCELVSKNTMDKLRTELSIVGDCSTAEGLLKAAASASYSHNLRKSYPYKCAYCGEDEYIGENEFKFMQDILPRYDFEHLSCLKKPGMPIGQFQ